MIISHDKKFVIYSPWKTASSTLNARLGHLNQNEFDGFYHLNPYLNRVVTQHLTCSDFQAMPESRLGYFSASFVRNPYDRVYSGFHQLQKAVVAQPKREFPSDWVRALVMDQLADIYEGLAAAGFEFDAWVSRLREDQVRDAGRNSTMALHPAHYWTHIAGKQVVDFIGRVETFESDFDALCARLDIRAANRSNLNARDEDSSPDYAPGQYKYTDRMGRSSIDRINGLFAEDFQLFDYRRL